jgi:DNA sulfur modification protein DndB
MKTEMLNNCIEVPCFMYLQSNKLYYSITLPMNQLERFLCIDNEFDVLKRSQRLIKENRVKKLVNYLQNGNFILPALTGYIDGEHEFKEIDNHMNIGYLKLSLDCSIKLFDGQHRASGIISACRKSSELKNLLRKSSITLNLTHDLTLDVRQQFFSDINSNSSKPSISLSSTYDRNNSRTVITHKIIEELELTSVIEYEKNVINKDDKFKLYTFKPFSDSIAKAFNIKKSTDVTDELVANISSVYLSWRNVFKWAVIQDTNFFRNKTINLHNVMISALGDVTKDLLDAHDNNYSLVAEKINKSRIDYISSFLLDNLYDVCIDSKTERIKLDSISKNNLKNYIINLID